MFAGRCSPSGSCAGLKTPAVYAVRLSSCGGHRCDFEKTVTQDLERKLGQQDSQHAKGRDTARSQSVLGSQAEGGGGAFFRFLRLRRACVPKTLARLLPRGDFPNSEEGSNGELYSGLPGELRFGWRLHPEAARGSGAVALLQPRRASADPCHCCRHGREAGESESEGVRDAGCCVRGHTGAKEHASRDQVAALKHQPSMPAL